MSWRWWLWCLPLLASPVFGQSGDIFRQIYIGSSNTVIRLVEEDPFNLRAREPRRRRTPLMVATEAGKLELVEFFLARGAEIDARDANGSTALRWAAFAGRPAIAALLLDKGASPDIFAVAMLGRTNELAALLKQDSRLADPPVRDIPNPLQLATHYGQVAAMAQLLEAGANPSPRNRAGQPLIVEAAGRDQVAEVTLLLDHGVSVNLASNKKETPLLVAAEKGSVELTRLLLERKANPHARDWRGWTPLHAAVFGNRLGNARALLERDVDVNARSNDGTPLHIAIWKHGNPAMVRLLLEHQADVTALDRRQQTPLALARAHRHAAVVAVLEEFGAAQ